MSYWKKFNDLVRTVLDWFFAIEISSAPILEDDKSTDDVNKMHRASGRPYEDGKLRIPHANLPPVVRNKKPQTKGKGKGSQKSKSKKGRVRPKGSKKKMKISQKSWPL